MYCNAPIFTDNKILTDQGILPTTSDQIFFVIAVYCNTYIQSPQSHWWS